MDGNQEPKVREPIAYLQRRGRLGELVAAAAKARSDANWPSVPAAALLLTMPLGEVPAGSRMPLLRNPLFVGWEADLMAVAWTLQGGSGRDAAGLCILTIDSPVQELKSLLLVVVYQQFFKNKPPAL